MEELKIIWVWGKDSVSTPISVHPLGNGRFFVVNFEGITARVSVDKKRIGQTGIQFLEGFNDLEFDHFPFFFAKGLTANLAIGVVFCPPMGEVFNLAQSVKLRGFKTQRLKGFKVV